VTLAYNILYCLSDHVTGAVALTYDIMEALLQTLYGKTRMKQYRLVGRPAERARRINTERLRMKCV